MIALLSLIVVMAFTVATLIIVMPKPKQTLYGEQIVEARKSNLPGPIARAVGNATRWKTSGKLGGSDTAIGNILRQSDNPWDVSILEFRGIVLLAALAGGIIGGLTFGAVAGLIATLFGAPVIAVFGLLVGAALGAFTGGRLPSGILKGSINKKARAAAKDLDIALDLFAMAVQSGYTIQRAIAATYQYLPEGPLRSELGKVLADVDSGVPFSDAMREMSERVPGGKLANFARVLIDCSADGRDRTETLRRNAREFRKENITNIDQRAGSAEAKSMAVVALSVIIVIPIPIIVPMFPLLLQNLGG